MHPQLKVIAERYGIPLSERTCYQGYVWDGSTLAMFSRKETLDEDCYRVIAVSEPLPLDDFGMAHELAHWVVADPVEREFPEYGCAVGIVGYLANGGADWSNIRFGTVAHSQMEMLQAGVLTLAEQNFREACADFLAVHWCDLYGIAVQSDWRPINKYTDYGDREAHKYADYGDREALYHLYQIGWQAIIWLRERNLIP